MPSDAPFAIYDATLEVGTRRIDQRAQPADFVLNGVSWDQLGTFAIRSGILRVAVRNDANGYVIADAVRIERVGDIDRDGVAVEPDIIPEITDPEQEDVEPAPALSIDSVIDNGDAGYSQIGPWQRWTGFGHSRDVAQAVTGSGDRIANWEFTVPSGVYVVSTTWPAHANRAFQRSLRDLRCFP